MKAEKSSPSLSEIEERAHELAGAEKWQAASQALLKVARAEPRNTDRWLQIARWQRKNHEPKLAAKTLLRALMVSRARTISDEAEAKRESEKLQSLLIGLLEAQLEQQDWHACTASARIILKDSPRHHFALEALATSLLQTGQIEESVSVMQTLLRLSPRDPLHRLKYATLLQLQGQSGASLEEFSRVLASFPDAPFAGDARDAIELLDTMQIQQILILASEQEIFRLQLQRDFDETLEQHGFNLSESGRESLRHMVDDGRIDAEPRPAQIH